MPKFKIFQKRCFLCERRIPNIFYSWKDLFNKYILRDDWNTELCLDCKNTDFIQGIELI